MITVFFFYIGASDFKVHASMYMNVRIPIFS